LFDFFVTKTCRGQYPGLYQLWEFPGHYQKWGFYEKGKPFTCPGDVDFACDIGKSVECCCIHYDKPHLVLGEETICGEGEQDDDEEDLFCFPPPFGCLSIVAIIALIGAFITLDLFFFVVCCYYCRNDKKRKGRRRRTFEEIPMNEEEEELHPESLESELSEEIVALTPPPAYSHLYPHFTQSKHQTEL